MELSEEIRGYGAGWMSKDMWAAIADKVVQIERKIDTLEKDIPPIPKDRAVEEYLKGLREEQGYQNEL